MVSTSTLRTSVSLTLWPNVQGGFQVSCKYNDVIEINHANFKVQSNHDEVHHAEKGGGTITEALW